MIEFFMIGNLGADAVVNIAGGQTVINFNVCHSESNKRRNAEAGNVVKNWVDCAYYADNPELVLLLTKGVQVYVKGFPLVKIHINKEGDPVAVQYLRVHRVEILSKKKRGELHEN
jgi:single-stranded DNA-binding protein